MRRELSDIIAQFDLALQAAQEIEDAWLRSLALERIAIGMAEAGQTEQAKKNLSTCPPSCPES
jgi:hypothetical protein